ncbi:UNVERIFIED_CONTAM: hypothetical protein RMT77_010006 [Armadillidium vulgare]
MSKFLYPEISFMKFIKVLEREGISWPVNLQMVLENKNIPIKNQEFEKLKELIVKEEEESHLFFINAYANNRSSIQMEEITYLLLKTFQKSKYKYRMILEDNDHKKYRLRERTNVRKLELFVRKLRWWKIIFKNTGLKNKYLHKMIRTKIEKEKIEGYFRRNRNNTSNSKNKERRIFLFV